MATLNNAKYWETRQNALLTGLERDEKKLEQMLTSFYEKEATKLEKDIASYYSKYGKDSVIEYRTLLQTLPDSEKQLLLTRMDDFALKYPEYSHILPVRASVYKLDRLEGLQYSIRLQQLEIGAIEQEEFKKHLSKLAERGYESVLDAIKSGSSFNSVNRSVLRTLVGRDWTGDGSFSTRIWGNREQLGQYLNNDFRDAVIRGDNYAKTTKAIRERFTHVSRRDALRLVYTEGTFVLNESQMQAFEDAGYTFYRYSAILDSKTSKICSQLDGQIFMIKDRMPGKNFPPMHPRCRSTFTIEDTMQNAEFYAPTTTEDLIDIGAETGMDLVGTDFKLKGIESYARKVKAKGANYQAKDALRYTYIASGDELVDKTLETFDLLKKKGYNVVRVENSWRPSSSYCGINTNFKNKAGYTYEIQFHTPESFELKNGKLHELYEEQRVLEEGSKGFAGFRDEMVKYSNKLRRPVRIERIVNYEK